MDLKTQHRLAADILKVGLGRVWMDSEALEEISGAVTRDDVRKLIKEGKIKAKQKRGISRYRARKLAAQRAKGRRRGHGSRKGAKYARYPKKQRWMSKIRAIRRRLKELRDSGKIDRSTYRKLYLLAKGGVFRSKGHVDFYIKEMKNHG